MCQGARHSVRNPDEHAGKISDQPFRNGGEHLGAPLGTDIPRRKKFLFSGLFSSISTVPPRMHGIAGNAIPSEMAAERDNDIPATAQRINFRTGIPGAAKRGPRRSACDEYSDALI